MAFENITLKGYISSPEGFAVMPEITPEVLNGIYRMLSPLYAPVFIKLGMMRKIRESIVRENITEHFDITLLWSLKPTAYMRDGGGMYFSLGLLLMKSPLAALPVFLHEISHILLSRMDGYGALKDTERQFRAEYGRSPDAGIMSPIELYADLMTEYMLTRAYDSADTEKRRKRLLRVLTHRKEKIHAAMTALAKLSQNNE